MRAMSHKILLIILATFTLSLQSYGQKEVRQLNRQGNKQYKSAHYQQAEIDYRKAIEINSKDSESLYNLSNTLYKTERVEEAGQIYQDLLKEIELLPKERAADVAHNAGNLMMAAQEYGAAVEMYKESLRRRPTDEETRYNLALAQKLLEEEKQDGDQGENENEQEQNDQQQDEQQQDQQQDEPQPQDDKQNKPQEQQSKQPERMSQDNAEKILDAYLQDEKDTQKKVEQMKQQQQKGKRSRPKNW